MALNIPKYTLQWKVKDVQIELNQSSMKQKRELQPKTYGKVWHILIRII